MMFPVMKRFARRGHPSRPHMAIRRTLFELIREIARRRGMNDSALAHCCGMTRPRASNLLHGRIERFNSETLVDVLAQLGVTVEAVVAGRQVAARWKLRNPRARWRWPEPYAPLYLTPDWREPHSEGSSAQGSISFDTTRATAGQGPGAAS